MKRFIIEETEFRTYDLTILTAVRMRNAVNDLNHDGPYEYNWLHVLVMDYFVMNSGCAPRESEVIAVVSAMANKGYSTEIYGEPEIKAAIRLLARPGKNKFLRIGRRSHTINGVRERLIELNYYHGEG